MRKTLFFAIPKADDPKFATLNGCVEQIFLHP